MSILDGDADEMRELDDLDLVRHEDLSSLASAYDQPIEPDVIRHWAMQASVFTRLTTIDNCDPAATPVSKGNRPAAQVSGLPKGRISVISTVTAVLATTFGKVAVATALTAAATTGGLAATDNLPGRGGDDPVAPVTTEAVHEDSVAEVDDGAVDDVDDVAVEDVDDGAVDDADNGAVADVDDGAVEKNVDDEAVEDGNDGEIDDVDDGDVDDVDEEDVDDVDEDEVDDVDDGADAGHDDGDVE